MVMQYIHNNNKTEYFDITPKGNKRSFSQLKCWHLFFLSLSLMLDLRLVKVCTYEQHHRL